MTIVSLTRSAAPSEVCSLDELEIKMRVNIVDDQGNIIAWLDDQCRGPNHNCITGYKNGKPFHIIPTHTDPRAADVHLALATYHYASRDEAIEALETSWATAITVDNLVDRDAAYRRNMPVKIKKNGNYR